MHDKLEHGTKELPPLEIGDHVLIQNQLGNKPEHWAMLTNMHQYLHQILTSPVTCTTHTDRQEYARSTAFLQPQHHPTGMEGLGRVLPRHSH